MPGYTAPPAAAAALLPAPWDPALLAALHSAPTPNMYTGGGDWYMDSGATNHMTSNPGNLNSVFPVSTACRITVGDGSSLVMVPFHLTLRLFTCLMS